MSGDAALQPTIIFLVRERSESFANNFAHGRHTYTILNHRRALIKYLKKQR